MKAELKHLLLFLEVQLAQFFPVQREIEKG